MNQQIVDRVMLALPTEPEPAHRIAKRANLDICQTYQALVRLYDSGLAFMAQERKTGRMEGWTS